MNIKPSCQARYLSIIAAIAILPVSNTASSENCRFSNASTKTFNIDYGGGLGDNLTIPKDAPIGTVVYEETVAVPAQTIYCPREGGYLVFTLSPTLGKVTIGKVFPLGKSGLSFTLYNNDQPIFVESRLPGEYSNFPYRNIKIQIFKSDNLSSQNTVPAGYIGSQFATGETLINFNLLKPINLTSASCQTPDVSVKMGDYELNEFTNPGDTPRTVKFNIGLDQCQTGIQKVTYSLTATSQVIDQQNGVVALNSSSTAKGIGLKLMNDAGQPIALGTTYPFSGFSTTGTSFKIPLSAAYYRLADNLEAGSANASVTFTVNYL
ncbi:hypothetical protein PS664_04798 [Pseudomonas fluorescens]|nr:hypothetical protein PS664_04798 [Pseudomonas fluorescens]